LAKGDALFREGDAGDALYVLLEGTAEVTKKDKAGKEQSLAKLSDGSALGEMSLITGSSARSATVFAATDARLLRISASAFSRLLSSNSVAALKVVHNLAQVMSRRLVLMDEKLIELMDKGKRKEELVAFQKILTEWSF
jgi:CRP-like cAMP-binding protein